MKLSDFGATHTRSLTLQVIPEWIDILGHMNLAAYVTAFDKLVDVYWFEVLRLEHDPSKSDPHACFVLENKVTYYRELRLGDAFRMEFQLLDYSSKTVHFFVRMIHVNGGFLAATSEQLGLHVDLTTRRSAPFPHRQLDILRELWERDKHLPIPEEAGKPIGIPKRSSLAIGARVAI